MLSGSSVTFPLLHSTNGELPCPPICNKMRHRFTLVRQEKPTGVRPQDDGRDQDVTHGINITVNKKTTIMSYGLDPDTDMFQVNIH